MDIPNANENIDSDTCTDPGIIRNLPVPHGWNHQTLTCSSSQSQVLSATPVSYSDGIPELPGVVNRYVTRTNQLLNVSGSKRKGWKRPGPGPNRGTRRLPELRDLDIPFMLAALHLAKESLHFQQLYTYHSVSSEVLPLDFIHAMVVLRECESDLPVSKAMKKNVWTMTHQLCVPAFLLKLGSPHHAIAMHILTDIPGQQWWCSYCRVQEISPTYNCGHVQSVQRCITTLSGKLGCPVSFLIQSMVQSAAFHHISDLSHVSFYGTRQIIQFAVLRTERDNLTSPITSSTPLHVVKRLKISEGWKCLTRSCSGYSTNCTHTKIISLQAKKSIPHCFSNIYELQGENVRESSEGTPPSQEEDEIQTPRHSRPIIPSENAFHVDFNVTRKAHNNDMDVLTVAKACYCGQNLNDQGSSDVTRSKLRIETRRCFVTYEQEVRTCRNRHMVTPEQDERIRDGIVWVSRDTAYTEVFLFELLLHMTSSGVTLSSQSDLRSQMLFLQTDYMSRQYAPLSVHCIRKALFMYAMAVVPAIPPWVFRCSKCASVSNDQVYYEKLSFDGQQLGFNISKDVRYDFYGRPATHWRRPVDRCTEAWKVTHIVESKHLRTIIMETLRGRDITVSCNSVHSMCRMMMSVPLRSQESIRAAAAAITLFDPESYWSSGSGPHSTHDSIFESFISSSNKNLQAHPLHFINEVTDVNDFNRGKKIMTLFRDVLDCRKEAMILSILIINLRSDLKVHVPLHDRVLIEQYSMYSQTILNQWLFHLSQLNSWALVVPPNNQNEFSQELHSGIAEHAEFLEHPFRPPFSWKQEGNDNSDSHWNSKRTTHLRKLGTWFCPDDAEILALLFLMAVLTESVAVLLRNGDLTEVIAVEEVLRNAEMYCRLPNTQYHHRASLQSTYSISILYEGLMGVLSTNIPSARPMFRSLRHVLEHIKDVFERYCSLMRRTTSSKSFMASPREFDDMLMWTGAFQNRQHVSQENEAAASSSRSRFSEEMKNLYSKMASTRSNDFMETGVWAPDLPIRRPSPSALIWANDISHTEASCSKDYNVHNAFSPGTFGGYCICKHAKTVIMSFLKRPEGCRMPLNVMVERLNPLPKYVIYEFACGTQQAAAGLSAEITRHTSFVVDPFHFLGHKTCSLAMHESSYMELRGCNFESQEQRNSRIKLMERTLRAC